MLDKDKHTDKDTGCLCRYVRSDTEHFRPHTHNYYEFFLMIKGKSTHIVNSCKQNLTSGYLLFIRDFDVHDYIKTSEEEFDFINLAFTKEIMEECLDYLGDEFDKNMLFSPKTPPYIIVTEHEKDKLFYEMSEFINVEDKKAVRLKLKVFLVNILSSYFQNYSKSEETVPLWLEMSYEKMKKPQNFIKGVERMYEMSGKTREHLSRSLKKYYNITPTEYVNELRLNYSANMLLSSNLSVAEVCFECGFENISWFYQLFTKKFKMSPKKYRKSVM